MNALRKFALLAIFAIASLGAGTPVQAGPPSYLLLRQATAPDGHPGIAVGRAVDVRGQGYAYGWFGACPRTHGQRHFGYYRNYTQWSSW
jgi:hypothetical protein